MQATFLIAAVAGAAVGCFLRVGALVATSFVFVIYAFVVADKSNLLRAAATCFALLATIQASYVLGLAIGGFGKKFLRFLDRWHSRMR